MLKLVHKSHLGMTKCKKRAREVLFWPCMNSEIENYKMYVQDCALCASYQNQQSAEPLRPTMTPDLPFSLVGCDLFDFQSKTYILTVDYYSKYIDVLPLESTNTTSIVSALKTIFAMHGIPTRLRSDNGPQFSFPSSESSVGNLESITKLLVLISKVPMEKPKGQSRQSKTSGGNPMINNYRCWTIGLHH